VSFNNAQANDEMTEALGKAFTYLPNIYPLDPSQYHYRVTDSAHVDVGCFGALRILKNQLEQAIAAMIFSDNIKKKLRFHINLGETEDANSSIYKNLEALFAGTRNSLVTHKWVPHDQFLDTVRQMDLGMQVSFSESFNIVVADFVFCGVPIVVSREVDWMPQWFWASQTTSSMVDRLGFAWNSRRTNLQRTTWHYLQAYNKAATAAWKTYLIG
jgi:hypothetical protein